MTVKTKRIYEIPSEEDGKRILVDRLWPRGVSKERAKLDLWLKDIAPSADLRKWYNHKPEKHEEFKYLYTTEVLNQKEEFQYLCQLADKENITLLYAAKDSVYNQAVILKELIESHLKSYSISRKDKS